VIVLGISTGGPQALRELIPRLSIDFPVPIAMVLHMPVGYTEMYARRLNAISALDVVEVKEGDVLRAGVVWLAPAGRHLTFARDADRAVRAHLDLRPVDTQHRPSVDVLFRSAAEVFGPRVLGVVMTGMGQDGLLGAGHIKAQGGRVVTEAESSCVVYGMPRAVAEASLSDRSATLDEMADAIMDLI
jgi:two-component system, chemotaxis family, protein-glutamate methylesterase/glutaminase